MDILRKEIERGIEIPGKGGVIAFPTDTVYGLRTDPFGAAGVAGIYEIKDRPRHQAFLGLIVDVRQLSSLVCAVPEIAWSLAKRFWPGGLTLALTKADTVPGHLAPSPAIAVRIPNRPVSLALLEGFGNPLIGTCANIAGQPSALTAQERQQSGAKIQFTIDAGRRLGGKESTIVDIIHDPPLVVREGIISTEEIERGCNEYSKLN